MPQIIVKRLNMSDRGKSLKQSARELEEAIEADSAERSKDGE